MQAVIMPKVQILYALMAILHQANAMVNRSLIIGGDLLLNGEFSFMVKLEDQYGNHKCGGTLIAPDTVLTAAHCLNVVAKVGMGPTGTYLIKKAIKHPGYSGRDHSTSGGVSVDLYDVGLIVLDAGKDKGSINPVRLNNHQLIPQSFAELIAVGWNTSDISDKLVTATYTYMPNSGCIESWGPISNKTIYYRDGLIDDSFCSVPNEKRSSVCSGDAGSPLLLISNGSALQVAVDASPIDCGSPALALLSVRVSSMYPWIELMVCQNSESIPESFSCNGTREPSTVNIPASMEATIGPATRNKSKAFSTSMALTFLPLMCVLLLLH